MSFNTGRSQATSGSKKVIMSNAQFPDPPAFKKASKPSRAALAEIPSNILASSRPSEEAQKAQPPFGFPRRRKNTPSIPQLALVDEDVPGEEDSGPVFSRRSRRTRRKLVVIGDEEDSDDGPGPTFSRQSLRKRQQLVVTDDEGDLDQEQSDTEEYYDEAVIFNEEDVSEYELQDDQSDSSTCLTDSDVDDEDAFDLNLVEDKYPGENVQKVGKQQSFDLDLSTAPSALVFDGFDDGSESIDDTLLEAELAEIGSDCRAPIHEDSDFDFVDDDDDGKDTRADASPPSAPNTLAEHLLVDDDLTSYELFPPDKIDPKAMMDDISFQTKSVEEWKDLCKEDYDTTAQRYRAGIHELKNIVMEQDFNEFFAIMESERPMQSYWFRIFSSADPDVIFTEGMKGVRTQAAIAFGRPDFAFRDFERLPCFDPPNVIRAGNYWHIQDKKLSDDSHQLTTYNGMSASRRGVVDGRINGHRTCTKKEYSRLSEVTRTYHYKLTCKEPGARIVLDDYRSSYITYRKFDAVPLCQLFEGLDAAYFNSVVFELEGKERSKRNSHAVEMSYRRVRHAMQEAVPDKPLPDLQRYASNRSWSLAEGLHISKDLRGSPPVTCYHKGCSGRPLFLLQQGNPFGPRICQIHYHSSEHYLARGPCHNCGSRRNGYQFWGAGESSTCGPCSRYRISHGHLPSPKKWATAIPFAAKYAPEYLNWRRDMSSGEKICPNCAETCETMGPNELCNQCAAHDQRREIFTARPPHTWSGLWDWVENVRIVNTQWSTVNEFVLQFTRDSGFSMPGPRRQFTFTEEEVEADCKRSGDTSANRRSNAQKRLRYRSLLAELGRGLTKNTPRFMTRQQQKDAIEKECIRLGRDPNSRKQRRLAATRLSNAPRKAKGSEARRARRGGQPAQRRPGERNPEVTAECIRLGWDPEDRERRDLASGRLRARRKKAKKLLQGNDATPKPKRQPQPKRQIRNDGTSDDGADDDDTAYGFEEYRHHGEGGTQSIGSKLSDRLRDPEVTAECLAAGEDPENLADRNAASLRLTRRRNTAAKYDDGVVRPKLKGLAHPRAWQSNVTDECIRLGRDPSNRDDRKYARQQLANAQRRQRTKDRKAADNTVGTSGVQRTVTKDAGNDDGVDADMAMTAMPKRRHDTTSANNDDGAGSTRHSMSLRQRPKRMAYIEIAEPVDEAAIPSKKKRARKS